MSAAPKHDTLAAALVACQAELPAVEPNATNPHFRSKFVSLDHLIAKTRPVLNRHGLSLSQWPCIHGDKPALETVLEHESGEKESAIMPLILAKQDMQGLGAAITYARRYAWAAALGISSDEDDDGESIVVDTSRTVPVTKATPKPATSDATQRGKTAQLRPLNERKQADIRAVAKRLEDAGVVSPQQFAHVLKTEFDGADDLGDLSADQGEVLLNRLRKKEAESQT